MKTMLNLKDRVRVIEEKCKSSTFNIEQNESVGQHSAHLSHTDVNKRRKGVPYMLPKMPVFDGNSLWDSFIATFGTHAIKTRMSREEKLDCFLIAMRGKAAKFYCALPDNILSDYDKLKDKFLVHWRSSHNKKTAGDCETDDRRRNRRIWRASE